MHSPFPEPFISRVVFSCCPQTSFNVSWRQELSLILLFRSPFWFHFWKMFLTGNWTPGCGAGEVIFFCNLTASFCCPIVCIVSDQKYIVLFCSVGVSCPFFSRHFTIAQLKKIFFDRATRHGGSQFPDKGLNLHSLNWKADSQPLGHQGIPNNCSL